VPSRATLRISAAWGLPDTLAEFGIDLAEMLDDAGLPPQLFADRENPVTYPELERLLRACARRTECEHIGLLTGQRARLADMGLTGAVAACAATVGEGLRQFVEHLNLHDTAAVCTLVESNGHARLIYAIVEPGLVDARQFQFGGIAIAFNVLQDLCGPDFQPTEVSFASRAPANLRDFQRLFHAPVHFDRDESSLKFPVSWLARPLPVVSAARRAEVAEQVESQRERMLRDFPASVRRILRKQLLLGNFTMDDIAGVLSMHRRTLDRHLKEHGVQYGELVESVKENVARQLLRDTTMPIQQIAESVRFSSAANFATAFRRRVGMTPSAYRKA
jgi:AraC-like DNA-binding protein